MWKAIIIRQQNNQNLTLEVDNQRRSISVVKNKAQLFDLYPTNQSYEEIISADFAMQNSEPDKAEFINNLPILLGGTLALLLEDIDDLPISSQVGLRVLAAVIDRLERYES